MEVIGCILLVIEDDCGAEGSVFIENKSGLSIDPFPSTSRYREALASGSIPCKSPTKALMGWFSKIPEPLRSRLEGAALATEPPSLGLTRSILHRRSHRCRHLHRKSPQSHRHQILDLIEQADHERFFNYALCSSVTRTRME